MPMGEGESSLEFLSCRRMEAEWSSMDLFRRLLDILLLWYKTNAVSRERKERRNVTYSFEYEYEDGDEVTGGIKVLLCKVLCR